MNRYYHNIITLEKLENTPLRVVVSYAPLVFSQRPACFQHSTQHGKLFLIC